MTSKGEYYNSVKECLFDKNLTKSFRLVPNSKYPTRKAVTDPVFVKAKVFDTLTKNLDKIGPD
jgi:hypothetical protein